MIHTSGSALAEIAASTDVALVASLLLITIALYDSNCLSSTSSESGVCLCLSQSQLLNNSYRRCWCYCTCVGSDGVVYAPEHVFEVCATRDTDIIIPGHHYCTLIDSTWNDSQSEIIQNTLASSSLSLSSPDSIRYPVRIPSDPKSASLSSPPHQPCIGHAPVVMLSLLLNHHSLYFPSLSLHMHAAECALSQLRSPIRLPAPGMCTCTWQIDA